MAIEEMKRQLQLLIESSNNEVLLQDLLLEAQKRTATSELSETKGLSKEDFDELVLLASEPAAKNTVSYDELKTNLQRWFIQ